MSGLWSRIVHRSAPGPASGRWSATLRAAAGVPFYAPWRKELLRARHVNEDQLRREALLRFPELELDYYFRHFRLFRVDEFAAAKPQEARSLWPGETRVAAVAPWFHVAGCARRLLKPDAWELRKFAPEVIAAPVDALEVLAQTGKWADDHALFALIALVGIGTPLLTPGAREELWRAFGVPVYVQWRGFQGELLARECEAHNGLHVEEGAACIERRQSGELLLTSLANPRHAVLRLASGLEAWFDMRVCGCGLASYRLMDLRAATGRATADAPPSRQSLSALAAAVGSGQGVEVKSASNSEEQPVRNPMLF